MLTATGEKIVIAATSVRALEVVCKYAIQLAKRVGKNTLFFVLLASQRELSVTESFQLRRELGLIERLCEAERIQIETCIETGSFPLVVANFLVQLDCPLLVVGEGRNQGERLRELKEIEDILLANKSWHHRNNHHFLMVSERRQDPVLVVSNGKRQNEKPRR